MSNLFKTNLNELDVKSVLRIDKIKNSNDAHALKLLGYLIEAEKNIQLKTDLIKIEANYIDLQNRYGEIYHGSPLAYFIFDENGIVIDLNPTAATMLGMTQKSILENNFVRYISPEFQNVFYMHFQMALIQKEALTCELKISKKNGLLFYAKLHSKALNTSASGVPTILSFISQISLHKTSETMDDEHMNGACFLDGLANNMTQEINHSLGVINNYLHGCITRLESNHFDKNQLMQAICKMMVQSERISGILLRMKNFNCKEILNFESLCINTLVMNAIALLKKEIIHFPVVISCKLTKHLPFVSADKVHIEQVILNLLRNAIDSLRDSETKDPKIIIESSFLNADYAEICIVDNGPGWPASMQYKLFDQDFSTKPYGIGIGLAISKAIILLHGGEILAESPQRGGSCFRIKLALEKKQRNVPKDRKQNYYA